MATKNVHPNSLKNLTNGRSGKPSKVSKDMKVTLLEVWNELQNDPKRSLMARAFKRPEWFYELCRSCFPKDIFVSGDLNITNMSREQLEVEVVRLISSIPTGLTEISQISEPDSET
jgi:hypothetical protein